ncbi:MAG: tetrahydromethanopterin S-methyltransferase subunit A [Candidatus Thorarchaeota archaeon]
MSEADDRKWPPAPGDYEIGDPSDPIAICTLGKKFDVPADYAIIGTCKTENIGIERVLINVISNPHIRYFILAGPEIPGHRTGTSLRSLYKNGIDPTTRKIIDAEGAIPYIENIPIEAVERFRSQVELVDMMNVSDPARIAEIASQLHEQDVEPFSEEPFWIEFTHETRSSGPRISSGDIFVLPEYGLALDPATSELGGGPSSAVVSLPPNHVVIEILSDESGTILLGKEVQ